MDFTVYAHFKYILLYISDVLIFIIICWFQSVVHHTQTFTYRLTHLLFHHCECLGSIKKIKPQGHICRTSRAVSFRSLLTTSSFIPNITACVLATSRNDHCIFRIMMLLSVLCYGLLFVTILSTARCCPRHIIPYKEMYNSFMIIFWTLFGSFPEVIQKFSGSHPKAFWNLPWHFWNFYECVWKS